MAVKNRIIILFTNILPKWGFSGNILYYTHQIKIVFLNARYELSLNEHETINIFIYLANRSLIKVIPSRTTLYELFYRIKSIYDYLLIFDSVAYALNPHAKFKEKMVSRSE